MNATRLERSSGHAARGPLPQILFAAVPALVVTFRWFRFSNFSYVLMTVYLTLRAIGAHYTYSEMPVFNWMRDDWQFSRNHYDRVVHFSFGLLMSFTLSELLVRVVRLRRGWARVGTVHVVMAFIVFLGEGFFPVNVLNALKQVPEVCGIFCATANPTDVVIAETETGRGILGVVDGFAPKNIEGEADILWRKNFLRQIGYKL